MENLLLCDASQPEAVGEICKRKGLGVEIQSFSHPDYLLKDDQGLDKHKRFYGKISPKALHGPFADLSPGSPDRLIREVTKKRFEFAHKYARLLGATHIILHHGYVPGTSGYRGWLKRSLQFWQDFLADKSPEIVFYLENLLEPDGELMGEVVSQADHPNLRICFDVGHAFCHGKIPLEQWVKDLGPLIGYVHLHDNNGDVDAHLSLGEGKLPLDQTCYALKRHAPKALWALEVGPTNLADSVFWLERHGYFSYSGD